jgi:hypothetical protein
MKHRCRVAGCQAKGVWMGRAGEAGGAYCKVHYRVVEWQGWVYSSFRGTYWAGIGSVHEGRKVGKPRSWKEAADAKGVQS